MFVANEIHAPTISEILVRVRVDHLQHCLFAKTYRAPERRQGVACCDVVNRGAAYSNGRIFYNTLDNYAVAVDAETGAEV